MSQEININKILQYQKSLRMSWLGVFLCFVLGLAGDSVSAESTRRHYYRYEEGLLSAFVVQGAVKDMLKNICILTDIKLRTYGSPLWLGWNDSRLIIDIIFRGYQYDFRDIR